MWKCEVGEQCRHSGITQGGLQYIIYITVYTMLRQITKFIYSNAALRHSGTAATQQYTRMIVESDPQREAAKYIHESLKITILRHI